MWDGETRKFEDSYRFLRNEHHAAHWATASASLRAFSSCRAERTYAAVGWGGHTTDGAHYPTEWSVLLRKRRTVSDPHKPVRCDTALPNLSPGRYWPGVTAVEYR